MVLLVEDGSEQARDAALSDKSSTIFLDHDLNKAYRARTRGHTIAQCLWFLLYLFGLLGTRRSRAVV